MTPELKKKILACTIGSKFGAILRCALDVERDAVPRFVGKATVTSDKFVMCNFIDSNGEHHHGAFVGAKSDVVENVEGLSAHLRLGKEDDSALRTLVDAWLGIEIIHVTAPRNVSYHIRRFYRQGHSVLVGDGGLTLEQAQAHCKNPETSSRTCITPSGREHTMRYGDWYDGYEVDPDQ